LNSQLQGPLDYHDKKYRPQFPGEVAKHHANAKVSEFDQLKKKIETLEVIFFTTNNLNKSNYLMFQDNGDGSKPKMAFNMMSERRYGGHNSEVPSSNDVRIIFVFNLVSNEFAGSPSPFCAEAFHVRQAERKDRSDFSCFG